MTAVFVECKKTDKVDFSKPLRRHILSEFGKDAGDQYDRAIEHLTTLREDLRLNTERTDGARDKYLQWVPFTQLRVFCKV